MQRCFHSVQWLSNVSTWPVLFREQGSIKVWSCLWKWIMSWTKEITEDLWKRVDVAHQARKVYKTISKRFWTPPNPVRQIVYKWRKFRPLLPSREVVDQQRSTEVCEVAKVPRVMSKQLKVFLTLASWAQHQGNIEQPWSAWQSLQDESHCSPKRKLLTKDHVDKPEDYWRKV